MGSHKERQAEPETNLFSKLPAERLVVDAGWILEVVAVYFSAQKDAQLHHLLQHSGCRRQHSNVIVQLNDEKEIQVLCNSDAHSVQYSKKKIPNIHDMWVCLCALTVLSSTSGRMVAVSSTSSSLATEWLSSCAKKKGCWFISNGCELKPLASAVIPDGYMD